MTDPSETIIAVLHRRYCQLTGYKDLPLSMERRWRWEAWLYRGEKQRGGPRNEAELETVVKFIRSEIRQQRRWNASLRFENLIGDYERFDADLSEAKATARNFAPKTDRDRVLESTGREPRMVKESVTAGQVLSQGQLEGLAALRKLKESLKA